MALKHRMYTMKKNSGVAGRPPLTTVAAILLGLRAGPSDVEGVTELLVRVGLKYSLSGVYAALLQARNAHLVDRVTVGESGALVWRLSPAGVEAARQAALVALAASALGGDQEEGFRLPPGWEVKPGLGERVFLVVPEGAARGVRERARRRRVELGDVRGRAPGSGTKMFEVASSAVRFLIPDCRGRAGHLAMDEVEGHEPYPYKGRL